MGENMLQKIFNHLLQLLIFSYLQNLSFSFPLHLLSFLCIIGSWSKTSLLFELNPKLICSLFV